MVPSPFDTDANITFHTPLSSSLLMRSEPFDISVSCNNPLVRFVDLQLVLLRDSQPVLETVVAGFRVLGCFKWLPFHFCGRRQSPGGNFLSYGLLMESFFSFFRIPARSLRKSRDAQFVDLQHASRRFNWVQSVFHSSS